MTILVALAAGALVSLGTWLLLQRRLSRIIIGVGLLAHAANLVLVVSGGSSGAAPLIGTADSDTFADPLPQALVLTAIVIAFGVMVLLLALGYRAWQLNHDDVVEDDIEDRYLARRFEVDPDIADETVAERAQAAEEDRR
jgi:multicomponent Na+:H+ antiporter subunit C